MSECDTHGLLFNSQNLSSRMRLHGPRFDSRQSCQHSASLNPHRNLLCRLCLQCKTYTVLGSSSQHHQMFPPTPSSSPNLLSCITRQLHQHRFSVFVGFQSLWQNAQEHTLRKKELLSHVPGSSVSHSLEGVAEQRSSHNSDQENKRERQSEG